MRNTEQQDDKLSKASERSREQLQLGFCVATARGSVPAKMRVTTQQSSYRWRIFIIVLRRFNVQSFFLAPEFNVTSSLSFLRKVGKSWVVGLQDAEVLMNLLDLVVYYALFIIRCAVAANPSTRSTYYHQSAYSSSMRTDIAAVRMQHISHAF